RDAGHVPEGGGSTEMLRVLALCETHDIGIAPHFTGPIATTALVHVLGPFPGPVIVEYNYGARPIDYLPEFVTFRDGKLWPNDRPGLGVRLDVERLKLVTE